MSLVKKLLRTYLLTRHSLSKESLEKLVALFDCQLKGGCAETAPQTRTGISDKNMLSQADAQMHSVDAGRSSDQITEDASCPVQGSNPAAPRTRRLGKRPAQRRTLKTRQ